MTSPARLPRYPRGPGHRGDAASIDGARHILNNGTHVTQSNFALATVEAAGGSGIRANDVYAAPDAPFPDLSTCRARLSELQQAGKIVKKGERIPGEAGVAVNLWIAARYAPPAPEGDQGNMFPDAA